MVARSTYQEEHVFALKQSYMAYRFFRDQILECEKNIENELKNINQNLLVEPKQPSLKKSKVKSRSKTIANRSAYYFDASKQIEKCVKVDLLEIPGMESSTLVKILSEIGTDMNRWPTASHFASWLGLCPNNKISGGKILSSKTKPCSNRVSQALRVAAHTLYRSKTALGSFFRRMRSKFGAPKAITATVHKMAKIIYYDNQYQNRVIASLKKRAKEFGLEVVSLER